MLCQRCQKNEANIFYKESVNGNENKFALCAECANQMKESGEIGGFNKGGSLFNLSLFDGGLNIQNPSALFGSLFGYPSGQTKRGLANSQQAVKRCSLCGSSYADITKYGKIGCPRCYDNFKMELSGTLRAIHGNVKHIGRSPKQFRQKNEKHNHIERLKEQLSKAIQAEAYENAAKLRDQIRELENQ